VCMNVYVMHVTYLFITDSCMCAYAWVRIYSYKCLRGVCVCVCVRVRASVIYTYFRGDPSFFFVKFNVLKIKNQNIGPILPYALANKLILLCLISGSKRRRMRANARS
jgi:hypothetical protein